MKFYVFSLKYRYFFFFERTITSFKPFVLLQSHLLFVNMVSVMSMTRYTCNTSASRYNPRYQSTSMPIRALIPRNFAELAEAVPIAFYWTPGPGFTMPP